MNVRRFRPTLGVLKTDTEAVLSRAQAIHDGMAADAVTYASPSPALPAFQTLILNTSTAQQLVKTRVVGAAATRDVERGSLFTGMETQCMYVQTLVDLYPTRALALIQNAGLVVAEFPLHTKPFLGLRLGKQSGTVIAYANVGLLVAAAAATKPSGYRFFNWQSTIDGGKTMVNLPSTPVGMTTLTNLTPLTTLGVRVSLTNREGPGDWSQIVSILVQ